MSIGPTKTVVFLAGISSPPLRLETKREIGFQLHRLQLGEMLHMPISRPMPSIGPSVHEIRVSDRSGEWRLVYRTDPDEIIVVEVFKKTSQATPSHVIALCRRRLSDYDAL